MSIIKLRDNRFDKNAPLFMREQEGTSFVSETSEELDEQKVTAEACEVLKKFDGLSLDKLVEKGSDAVVDLSEARHLSANERKSLCFFRLADKNDCQFRVETGNLMGVLRFRDKTSGASVQVEILSRFDKGENSYFLNYLLSKVFDCAFGVEAIVAERSSILWLLLDMIFVRRLGEAAKVGLLRHYREFRNNDWNFKGTLDLQRHIRENFPLMRGIAYRKREIDFDVPVNRMILMAALLVDHRHPEFFESNRDAADALRQLRMNVTEERSLRTVLANRDCRESITHPFFREVWEPLRRIARMILEDEHWTLFADDVNDEEEVSGVVFDGSWLWEEYIAAVLKEHGSGWMHCGRSIGGGLSVFQNGSARFYPDFILNREPNSNSADIVLDAKYKRSNLNGDRCDVHQVLCYLLLTGAKLGGLVFPPIDDKCETKEDQVAYGDARGRWSEKREIASPYSDRLDSPVRWRCFSWAQSLQSTDWNSFRKYMREQEESFLKNPLSD